MKSSKTILRLGLSTSIEYYPYTSSSISGKGCYLISSLVIVSRVLVAVLFRADKRPSYIQLSAS